MANRAPGVPLIATQDGHYVAIMDDGSTVVYDASFNVVGGDSSPNPARLAAIQSGDADASIDAAKDAISGENARRWDITSRQAQQGITQQGRALAARRDEIEHTYRVNLMNAQTSQAQQEATAQYQRDSIQNLRDRLAFDREAKAADIGLAQAGLGYDLLKTGVDYHNNPADYFNEAEWTRGVAGNPQTSTFLGALQNNTRMPGFTGRGDPAQVADLGSLTAKLMGGGGVDNSGNYLAQIGNIGAKGPQQLGAGALEQLTPTERSLFTGGLKKLGYDPSTFLSGYARSRIGQGLGSSRAA